MGGATAGLSLAVQRFAEAVVRLPFHLDEPGARARDALVFTAREYLLPRLADLDAPLVAVILGSTGAGKSTVMNSLAGHLVTRPGAIRPTTTDPVVWCHPDHTHRYDDGFITGYGAGGRPLRVESDARPLLEHLTVVDTPDIDSVEVTHHEVAEDLRRIADVVVFVTSAQRYADEVPWRVLGEVRRRGTPVVFVLNRLPRGGAPLVRDHDRRLRSEGFGGLPVAIVPEQHERHRQLLPDALMSPLRSHLAWLARADRRGDTRRVGLAGALGHVVAEAAAVREALAREADVVDRLVEAVDHAYVGQREELHRDLLNGTVVRGEVLARWQEFVGTGEILRAASNGVQRVRDWTRSTFGGRPRTEVVHDQATDELVLSVVRRCQVAVEGVVTSWEQTPVGRDLLARDGGAGYRIDPETELRAREAVRRWATELGRLVETQGGDRRRIAAVASTGVNALAVVAILATFANTSGITGAEVGITAGAAAAQQRVLEHVFGAAAARALVARARSSLQSSVAAVLDADAARYRDLALSRAAGRTEREHLATVSVELEEAARAAGLWTAATEGDRG